MLDDIYFHLILQIINIYRDINTHLIYIDILANYRRIYGEEKLCARSSFIKYK